MRIKEMVESNPAVRALDPVTGKMEREILIVGTGALACLFAYRLAAVGVRVTMLGTWPEGLAALRRNGVQMEGAGSYPVQAVDDPSACRGARLALVLVKSWQTERAARQLSDCLSEDGLAVTLQNGLGNDKLLARRLGRKCVARGVTTLGVTLLTPGLVRPGGEGSVVLESHPRLSALKGELRIANVSTKTKTDIDPEIWGKLLVNAAINPLTALLRVKNGGLLENPSARTLMGQLACEAAEVVGALGIMLPFRSPQRAAENVARKTSENLSSMLQDILRGAPTEIDAINGAVIQWGKRKGIPTPANSVIWALVKALTVRGKI